MMQAGMVKRQPILERLRKGPLLADGGMGTQLVEADLPVGSAADEWCLTRPDDVAAIHRAYVNASAEVLLTNSFQASPPALGRHGLGEKTYAINLAAARIARDCINAGGYVFGDIGPFGGFLEPLGTTTRAELEDAFTVQVAGLLDGGVDAIIMETMTALEEIEVICGAVRACRSSIPIIGSVTFDRVADGGFRTMTGGSVADVVGFMERLDVHILGCNCGTGLSVDDYVRLVAEYRAITDRPIMVQPNAGQPRLDRGRIVYDETPEKMAAAIPALLGAGANVVGGCCGTTPEHIRLFRQQLDRVADAYSTFD
jgi:5-methyltetrahydrofolate--homocysteine methyltransferase